MFSIWSQISYSIIERQNSDTEQSFSHIPATLMSDLFKPPSDHIVKLAPPWVPTFRTRNTFEILWSCIFTFFFSAWTTLHPDIPNYEERKAPFRAKIARFAWMAICGLLLPEFILLSAIVNHIRARRITRRLRNM